MKALLWKDCRLNRMLLIFGAIVLLGPFLIGVGSNAWLEMRTGEADWSGAFWIATTQASLVLSMFTIVMLGANSIAAERADRSAEFLAYLPPSHRQIIASKAIVVLSAVALIWLVNLASVYVVAPLVEGLTLLEMLRSYDRTTEMLWLFAATSVILLGVSWFFSAISPSHGLATALGIGAPIMVSLSIAAIDYFYKPSELHVGWWYKMFCFTLGSAGFVGGIVCYLRRVEP